MKTGTIGILIGVGIILFVAGLWWFIGRAIPTGNERFERVNYQGVDCIVYHSGYKGGLSCDWGVE